MSFVKFREITAPGWKFKSFQVLEMEISNLRTFSIRENPISWSQAEEKRQRNLHSFTLGPCTHTHTQVTTATTMHKQNTDSTTLLVYNKIINTT